MEVGHALLGLALDGQAQLLRQRLVAVPHVGGLQHLGVRDLRFEFFGGQVHAVGVGQR